MGASNAAVVSAGAAVAPGPARSKAVRSPGSGTAERTVASLLERLVEQELAGMRLAEALAGPASFEELFELYAASRFLYAAKHDLLAPRLGAVEHTWRRLLSANDRVFKILMRRGVEQGRVVPRNTVCAWRYTPGTWQAQHLVSRDRHEYVGTLAALIGLADWLTGTPGFSGMRMTYRPENPGVRALFSGIAEALGPERASVDLRDYYLSSICRLPAVATSSSGAVSILRVDAASLPSLRAFYRSRLDPTLLESLCLEDPELADLDAVYAAQGLARRRAIFAAVHGERIVGSVLCNLGSEGVNFSFLESSMECLELCPELSGELRGAVFGQLVRAAGDYYHQSGRDHVVALLRREHSGLAGEVLGLRPGKRYAVLTVNSERDSYRLVRQSFVDYYRRLVQFAARQLP
jgi:hypothetical protein